MSEHAVEPEQVPLVAQSYVAAVVLSAMAALWLLSGHDVVVRPAGTFITMALLAIFLESLQLTYSYRGRFFALSMGSAFMLALLTVFGVLPAIVVQVVASLAGDIRSRKAWSKTVFNASQFVLTLAATGAVLEGLLGERLVYPGMSYALDELPVLLLALAVFFLVNNLLVGTIIRLVSGWSWTDVFKRSIAQESVIEASALFLVPIVAISMRQSPALGPFLLVPLGALFRATHLAMENVTLLEKQAVALRESHAAEEAAAERERARHAADRANRAKSEFVSQMSHELRTPLNAVLGFAQLLGADALSDEQEDWAKEIIRAGEHLLALVNEVLDISAIEAGGVGLTLEPVDAGSAVKECVSLLKSVADNAGIALQLADVPDECGHVMADRQRLKQVVLNIVSNAIKYNRQNGRVRVSLEYTDHDLAIDVSDTGHGIPLERMDQLFVPFERLGAEGTDIEGTGLGLALSKGLVEAMGGTLSVSSVLDEGSTFSIRLPRT